MNVTDNYTYESMVLDFLSVAPQKTFNLERFMKKSAKKYYDLDNSHLKFEKQIGKTKICSYNIYKDDPYYVCTTCNLLSDTVICEKCWNEEDHVGHEFSRFICDVNQMYCDCGTYALDYNGFCENHKKICDHVYSSKCISILNSLIQLCESDLSIYTYICSFFSSSLKKHNSLFNKKIVDIDRSFLTLINIKDQAPFICIFLFISNICEDEKCNMAFEQLLLLLTKDPRFLIHCLSLYPFIIWFSSVCFLHFFNTISTYNSFYNHHLLLGTFLNSYSPFFNYKQFINPSNLDSIYIPLLPDINKYINNENTENYEQNYFKLLLYTTSTTFNQAVNNKCIYT
ncbi:hypothetical protein WA158_004122 [Blastocystis sp. Blastoise]